MKTCTKCKVEKADNDYYRSKVTKSGFVSWCKSCVKELSAKRRDGTPHQARSTALALKMLWQHDIPAYAGRKMCGPYIDIVAWGCVPVEAKLSSQFGNKQFIWTFSPNQLQHLEGFIMLIAHLHASDYRVLVVPTSSIDPAKIIDDNGSRSICVTLDSYHHLSHWPKLCEYEDRFDLINTALPHYADAYTHKQLRAARDQDR